MNQWMTVKEAAKHIAVNEHYIYIAVEQGALKHTRLMGKRNIRIKPEWLDHWMEQHTQQ